MVFSYFIEDNSFSSLAMTLPGHPYLLLTLASFACFLTWRIWKFSISPQFNPDDPKELPYWIPILGHGISFFRNSNYLLDYARKYFGDREVYSITAAGSKLYILTDPQDVTEAYKNTSTLSFEEFVQAMMRTSGSSEHVVLKMYETPDPEKAIFPNPRNKPLAKLARDLHHHQLLPGKELDSLLGTFIEYFDKSLNLKHLKSHSYAISSTENEVILPLYMWSSDVMICGGQEAYFGPCLGKLEPNLTWDFLKFDDLTWQVLYQYPKFLARTMFRAKSKVIAGLERYFELPAENRGGSSWFTPNMENEMRNLGFDTHQVAIMMMTIYWGINTNTRRACFWMFTFILQNPNLLEAVREETKGSFLDGRRPDMKYLEEKCPTINGIWNETLRLSAYSSSVRYVSQDTRIGGKMLRKGNRVMIPNRQLHFNEKVFGGNVHEFDPKRFMDNEGILRNASWRPFGGGTTICPGRFIAKQATLCYIAMVLQRFDVEVAGEKRFPIMEEGNPVLGIMSTKDGDDFMIRLTPRKAK